MLVTFPCTPSFPFSPTDKAYLRCEVVSNFGANFVTLILRSDGSLGSTAGEISDWHYYGDWVVCQIPNDYNPAEPALFAVKKNHALLRLVAPSEYK
jgi:hypothetical protein